MTASESGHKIELFATCPSAPPDDDPNYRETIINTAQWSERAGYRGILVYSDNAQYDPWTVARLIIENTESLCPLVAVQPVYMHPYTVAKQVASIARLHGRRVYLNMVAGGFRNDLIALGDPTQHDQRYERLTEYTRLIMDLLRTRGPVNFQGDFYQVKGLRLAPSCPPDLVPGIFISGSSDAGKAAARATGATAIEYPQPVAVRQTAPLSAPRVAEEIGIRIGIIAREDGGMAWQTAYQRFPEDRAGQMLHELATKASDSQWHQQLSELARKQQQDGTPYWLGPFRNYKTMCPYLVGSYSRVAMALSDYIAVGYHTFIIDVPESASELEHIARAFSVALEKSA